MYWILHRYDLLLEQARRLFDLESNFFGTYWLFGMGALVSGNATMRPSQICAKQLTLGGGPIQLADLGCLLGLLGRKAEAQQVLEDLNELGKQRYVQPAYRGFVHASLGNYDEAFACFARGHGTRKRSALHSSGNTASLPVWTSCVPTRDSRRYLKKSDSKKAFAMK